MAARSRSVGCYDLVVEAAKSQLGPLWAATISSDSGVEPRWVRCIACGPGAQARDVDALADLGRWSSGFRAEQAVSTLDVVSTDGALGLVTSYVPAEPLRSLLRLANLKRGIFSMRLALGLTLDLCTALAAAEARAAETGRSPEFLWGGLTPDSILVGTDGTARLLDLAVAAQWRHLSSEAQHPEVVAYSAPEQLEQNQASANSDVFTLGILLWEMSSGGKRLFAGASQRAVAEKLRRLSVPPLAAGSSSDAVVAEVRALLGKMLEPDPGRRMRDVRELKASLEAMGNAVAHPRELAAFVASLAQHPLESRERALSRALQRGADPLVRRPASEPPPRPASAGAVRPEALGVGAAKPLPLPAQVKLGARVAPIDARLPPPPPPLRAFVDLDPPVNDDDDAGGVKAEDIMAALAIEDLEPETDATPVESASESAAEASPARAAAGAAELAAPISSGRRAPLTAVVVPSVVAGPDAPTLTPVPSVLETLRGPGVPPPFDFASTEREPDAFASGTSTASGTTPAAFAEPPSSEHLVPRPPGPAPSALTTVAPAIHGLMRGARRLPAPLVAAIGGTALLLLIALVSFGGGAAPSAPEQGSRVLAEPNTDNEPEGDVKPTSAASLPGTRKPQTTRVDAAKPAAVEDENAPPETGTEDAKHVAVAAESQTSPTLAAAPIVTAPRVASARPTRRSSAAARPTTLASKKKKLRATRTYIPSGI